MGPDIWARLTSDLAGLALHERAVARDLEILGVPAANWPAKIEDATGQPVLDVLVVGAGMNGIAAAGSLMFKGRSTRGVARLFRAFCTAGLRCPMPNAGRRWSI